MDTDIVANRSANVMCCCSRQVRKTPFDLYDSFVSRYSCSQSQQSPQFCMVFSVAIGQTGGCPSDPPATTIATTTHM